VITGKADQGAMRMVLGLLCEFILKEIIDPKGPKGDALVMGHEYL